MTRNPGNTLRATWFLMIALQTIGSVDAKHKLPAPRQFAAIAIVWSMLHFIADIGYGKVAARFSVLVLLTGMVVGPFGMRLANLFNTVAKNLGSTTSPSAPGGAAPTSPGAPSSPGSVAPMRPRMQNF